MARTALPYDLNRTSQFTPRAADSSCAGRDFTPTGAIAATPTAASHGPVRLPCGQLALALAGALCGPAALRDVRPRGSGPKARVALAFAHPTVGTLELTVRADDEAAHAAIRAVRADACGYARLFALLAAALELDGAPGRFTFEAVHHLTHGPRPPSTNRAKANQPVEDLLTVLTRAHARWTPPGKAQIDIGPLLELERHNHKARTLQLPEAARPLLTKYTLPVGPGAFDLSRPLGATGRRPPQPLLARLKLAALIAARWRGGRANHTPQRVSFGDLLARFAWIDLAADGGAGEGGGEDAAAAAARRLAPRLRETLASLTAELTDPGRLGGGLLGAPEIPGRTPLRALLALAPASKLEPPGRLTVPLQPRLDDAGLRDAARRSVFDPDAESLPHDHDGHGESVPGNQDADSKSLPGDQHRAPVSLPDSQNGPPVSATLVHDGDGRTQLDLGNGIRLDLTPEQARALASDWLLHDHHDARPPSGGSLPQRQPMGPQSPAPEADSMPHRQSPTARLRSTAGNRDPESSPDDSDRGRADRRPATAHPPSTDDRRDDLDHLRDRRTA